jgi:hypothetical protein
LKPQPGHQLAGGCTKSFFRQRPLVPPSIEHPHAKELIAGQGQELIALLGEDLAYGARPVLGAAPVRCLALRPGERLGIEVVEVGIGAGGEEGVTHVADRSLDAALLVAPSRRDRTGLIMVMATEREQRGVEADGVADALQHCAFEVIGLS